MPHCPGWLSALAIDLVFTTSQVVTATTLDPNPSLLLEVVLKGIFRWPLLGPLLLYLSLLGFVSLVIRGLLMCEDDFPVSDRYLC